MPLDEVEGLAVADAAGSDRRAIEPSAEEPAHLVLDATAVEHPRDSMLDPAGVDGTGDVGRDHHRRRGALVRLRVP